MTVRFFKDLVYGNWLTAVIRIILGAMFLYSGFFKVKDPSGFGDVILQYDILPSLLIPYAALLISSLELICGALLVMGYRIKSSSLILITLVSLFTLILFITILRGKSFDCGCFETERFGISEEVGYPLIIRDLLIIGFLLLVYRAKKHGTSLDQRIEKSQLKEF